MAKSINVGGVICAIALASAACDEEALLAEFHGDAELVDELLDPADAPLELSLCATMYEHIHFGGEARPVGAGAYVSWIGSLWNDQVSSIDVTPGCALNAYEHIDFGGAHTLYLGSVPWVGDWWNDRISSYTCTCP